MLTKVLVRAMNNRVRKTKRLDQLHFITAGNFLKNSSWALSPILHLCSSTRTLLNSNSHHHSLRRVRSCRWLNDDCMIKFGRTGIFGDSLRQLRISFLNPLVLLMIDLSCSSLVHIDNGVGDSLYYLSIMSFIIDCRTVAFLHESQRTKRYCLRRVAWAQQICFLLHFSTVEAFLAQSTRYLRI